jgi:FMN reductase
MAERFVLALSGSPSPTSKTAILADYVLDTIRNSDSSIETEHFRARDIDPVSLLTGKGEDPLLSDLAAKLDRAHGVIIATPVFKASFSGLLKATLDVLPQFGLAGKVVLPIGTGGSIAHVLALDYGLRPVLQSMGARHIVQAHFVCETDMDTSQEPLGLLPQAAAPLSHALANFVHSLSEREQVRMLGHPRPPQSEGKEYA